MGGGLCYLGEMKRKKKGFIIIAKFELKGGEKKKGRLKNKMSYKFELLIRGV